MRESPFYDMQLSGLMINFHEIEIFCLGKRMMINNNTRIFLFVNLVCYHLHNLGYILIMENECTWTRRSWTPATKDSFIIYLLRSWSTESANEKNAGWTEWLVATSCHKSERQGGRWHKEKARTFHHNHQLPFNIEYCSWMYIHFPI
jgi:hypothetical protein